MKTIIIDDEERARNVLQKLLELNCPGVEVVATCENVPDGVKAIHRHQPDLVFLDVEMPDYAGYELINFLEEINFKIIFATAYDQYALKAFELSAVDYLLKPINRQRLIEAVTKAQHQVKLQQSADEYQVLLESIQEKNFRKIIVSHLNQKQVVLIKNIIAIEADRAYSTMYLEDGSKLMISKNIGHLENLLPKDGTFFRSHKSWLINVEKINSFSKKESSIFLNANITAKLSKHRVAAFNQLELG